MPRAIFFVSKQPYTAVEKWASSLQASGAPILYVAAWSSPEDVERRQLSSTCNVDPYLLGSGTTLESHLAQTHPGESLLLVALDPQQQLAPRSGAVLLVWQPQVPQDVVLACQPLPSGVADAGRVKGLLVVDPSPSLTLSVIHKALDGAGLSSLARKPTVLATRTLQAAHAATQSLLQLADPLAPSPTPPPAAPHSTIRIAVARDEAFGPCFHENLSLMHQAGAQLAFFSPLCDTALPAGATCLYLCSGPLEPERWQQLATNRPLLAAVRAFCKAGGAVLAEGGGLPYLSRSVELAEEDGAPKQRTYDMAGFLPFKASLLPAPHTAAVALRATAGNPLLPAGAAPRGYLCAVAALVLCEERAVAGWGAPLAPAPAGKVGAAGASGVSTTYQAAVVRAAQPRRQQQETAALAKGGKGLEEQKDGAAAAAAAAHGAEGREEEHAEGYTLNNVLASSCLLYLPSLPGLAAHIVQRCAAIDAGALGAAMAAALGPVAAAHGPKLHAPSAGSSRAGSRRQSIQEVPGWGGAGGGHYHHPHHPSLNGCSHGHPQHHPLFAHHGHAQSAPAPLSSPRAHSHLAPSPPLHGSSGSLLGGGCGGQRCSLCGHSGLVPESLSHSGHGGQYDMAGHASAQPSHAWSNGGSSVSYRPSLDSSSSASCFARAQPPLLISRADSAISMGPSGPGRGDAACSLSGAKGGHGEHHLATVMERSSSCSAYTPDGGTNPIPIQVSGSLSLALSHAASVGAIPLPLDAAEAAGQPQPQPPHSGPFCGQTLTLSPPCLPSRMLEEPGSAGPGPYAPGVAALPHVRSHSHSEHGSHSTGYLYGMAANAGSWHGHGRGAAGLAPCMGGGAGGVVCCAPGACEALVAMGLGSRLTAVSADCDHPADVCASRRVVMGWAAGEEARGRAGQRADRERAAGCSAGGAGGGRVLLVDELALQREGAAAALVVLPDLGELGAGEQAQLEQALVRTGVLVPHASAVPAPSPALLHVACRRLVDVFDFMLELGGVAGEPAAASMLVERLQARVLRLAAAAAAACSGGGERPRVLVLQSLQPLVEAGRWVPEMLALSGCSPCLAEPGGPDVPLTWADIRERARPDVLIVLTPPSSSSPTASTADSAAVREQLAALAAQPGWWCLPAVQRSAVYLMAGAFCGRAGPRLVDGAELLARLLLPGGYACSRKAAPGAVMRLSLAAGQRCRVTLLPSYFVPMVFG